MGELLGMRVNPTDTIESISAQDADKKMRWVAELKARGYYTSKLERLQKEFEQTSGAEKDERGREYVAELVETYRLMPRRSRWRRRGRHMSNASD